MEKFEVSKGEEKTSAPRSTPDQIGAARHLEDVEFKKSREARVQRDQDRTKELQAEIKPVFPKIELDYSKDEGVTNKGRRGAVLAAEHAWSKEKPKAMPVAQAFPQIPPPKRSFLDRFFS